VPLDTDLAMVREDDASLALLDGDTRVIEARSAPELRVDVPPAVAPSKAREASAGYRGLDEGPFSQCFVCGLAREDAFGVFAGEIERRGVVASPWTPPRWTAGNGGDVLPVRMGRPRLPDLLRRLHRRAADERPRSAHGAASTRPCGLARSTS
jgi:hypothetical protein